jgi:hypothetical protein
MWGRKANHTHCMHVIPVPGLLEANFDVNSYVKSTTVSLSPQRASALTEPLNKYGITIPTKDM